MSNNGYVLHDGEVMDRAESEIRNECKRLGIENNPYPEKCTSCDTNEFLEEVPGMVGEAMVRCTKCGKILWSDQEGTIRRVF